MTTDRTPRCWPVNAAQSYGNRKRRRETGLGNRAEAETAYRAAARPESLPAEDGPPVRKRAQAKPADDANTFVVSGTDERLWPQPAGDDWRTAVQQPPVRVVLETMSLRGRGRPDGSRLISDARATERRKFSPDRSIVAGFE